MSEKAEYYMRIKLIGYYPELPRDYRIVTLGKTVKAFKTVEDACDFRDKCGLVLH